MPARHRPLAAAIGLGAAGSLAVGALAASWIRPTPAAATRRVVRAELALTGPAALSFGGYGRDFEIARDGSRLV